MDDVEITISTDDRFISFSNKKFNVLADKQFKIQGFCLNATNPRDMSQRAYLGIQSEEIVEITKNVKFSVNYK
ncbi:MAG: hypothetical protein R2883_03930 [Caldisericia bacterium]